MGMYTSYRFKVRLKNSAIQLVKDLNDFNKSKSESGQAWEKVANKYAIPSIKKWSEYYRRDFIPFGMGNLPDCWQSDEGYDDGPWNTLENNIWEGACSLKNYESEIEAFHKLVLEEISEEIFISEKVYEEFILDFELGGYSPKSLIKG